MAFNLDPDFRHRVAALCEKVGGVRALERLSGVPHQHISKYSVGEQRPTLGAFIALARGAGVSLEWLATGKEAKGDDAILAVFERVLTDFEEIYIHDLEIAYEMEPGTRRQIILDMCHAALHEDWQSLPAPEVKRRAMEIARARAA